ncbi:MAG: DNA polymerase III subunit delta' [Dehalococcoidia bacterium]|jgi:DNA polymerase-3 subunit delta'
MWTTVGHEAVVELLDNSLKNDRLSHAYLFVGPAQVGKMTLAINLAQALNCENSGKPCGLCTSCKRILDLKHADVQVIDLAGKTEISIDQIRELERYASLKPFEGKSRVFIIDNADFMSSEAANCLLKTLEEPPPFVYMILLSTSEKAILSTILSRCQKLELRPIATSAIEHALIERYGTKPEDAHVLARLSSGCMGWAVNTSTNADAISHRKELIETLVNIAKADRLEKFSYSSSMASQFSKNRAEVQKLLSLWVSWWRDLLLIKGDCREIITNIDHQETLFREEVYYDIIDIRNFIVSLIQAGILLKNNANPRLVLDVLILGMPKRKGC